MNENMFLQSASVGMDTVISHKVFGGRTEEALRAAEEETVRLEGMLSRFKPESEISRINAAAGIRCEKVSGETFEALSRALEFSKCCQGCFDVTIGPLTALWSVSKNKSRPPRGSKIKKAIPLVDYNDLALDPSENTVALKRAGQSIDLGGIGKGFAADKILEAFKKYGVTSAFTNFGGNVAAIGAKPDGSRWHIGIRHPRRENDLIGVVSVTGRSVVTSGDYQRCFTGRNGKRYHHILDPATGYPSEAGLTSATVVADSSTAADALSAILFTAGMKRGLQILKAFPGAEAVLVDANLSVYVTQGIKDYFQAGKNINTLNFC